MSEKTPSDSSATVKASMSDPLEAGAPAGSASAAVLAGRRGSRFHCPAGATSHGHRCAAAARGDRHVPGGVHGGRPDGRP